MEDIEYGVHAFELITAIFNNNEKLLLSDTSNIVKRLLKSLDKIDKEN
jgi:hypothetical protein